MKSTIVTWVFVILSLPVVAYSQEARVTGTVTDSTDLVLPGVTVTARHVASGNAFQDVTDGQGAYQMSVRVGTYELTAELAGFQTVTQTGIEVLAGRNVSVNLQLAPSGVEETVTVTGESPLVEVTQSSLGSNIEPLQIEELPVNGRNWMDLAQLAPGARRNDTTDAGPGDTARRNFQINLDGAQITTNITGGTIQPRLSREAIAEFQYVAGRFDATQGRASGIAVNAITKSGTNTPSGSVSGYFRSDNLNAADHVAGEVLPYSNQQIALTYGGPIIQDKFHFFANYEYEREPSTTFYTTPYPSFNLTLANTRRLDMAGGRVDYQLSPERRLMGRGAFFRNHEPFGEGSATSHPAAEADARDKMYQVFGTLTAVYGDRALNEIRGGYHRLYYTNINHTQWQGHPQAPDITTGSPRITFQDFEISGNTNQPQKLGQHQFSVRDDFTYSFEANGTHTVKLGGEFIWYRHDLLNSRLAMGIVNAQGGPTPANLEELFPVWDNADTWNLDAINDIVTRIEISVGNYQYAQIRQIYAAYFQDDWTVLDNLTLNLGVRYDLATGMYANDVSIEPWLSAGRPDDSNNIAPRFGFAYSLNDYQTVIRGGAGIYYGEVVNNISSFTLSYANIVAVSLENDGRPDFMTNPWNGPTPSFEEASAVLCTAPGLSYEEGVRQAIAGECLQPGGFITIAGPPDFMDTPKSYQASIGFQHQLRADMAIEADYTYNGGRNERFGQGHFPQLNHNNTFNPATGDNRDFRVIKDRWDPRFGVVQADTMTRYSNYHGLQTAFNKRFSNRWQLAATYLLSKFQDSDPAPFSGVTQVDFPVRGYLGGNYGLAEGDQRHRAVVNGVWDLGYGFQLSGLYFYGSGERFDTRYGGDTSRIGRFNSRLRPDGTIKPRNDLVGDPIHRIDLRFMKKFSLGERASVDGIVEVFNLFDHANFGSYQTQERSAGYGEPTQNSNLSYAPRMVQLGFRFQF